MKAKKTKLYFPELPKDYTGLVSLLPPRTIHDATDYANIKEVTDAMAVWHEDFTPDQEDYFDLLCRLLEAWDAEHVKWPKKRMTGLEALKFLMAENHMSGADLARLLGVERTLGARILQGNRQLTVEHIAILAKRFCTNPGLFVPR